MSERCPHCGRKQLGIRGLAALPPEERLPILEAFSRRVQAEDRAAECSDQTHAAEEPVA